VSAVIDVVGLSKSYRVHRRAPGVWAALGSVFHRRYETQNAVCELSFHIEAGERVGFLGPNGAGKTTTLKMLAGLLHPSAGTVRVASHTPQERNPAFLKAITLVMGQKQQLLWDLPPSETYAMNRAIYDLPRAEGEATQKELVELLEVGDLIHKPTRQLSLGERMKCELVAALLHRPRVLFLDEPTIGLDVSMQEKMRTFIRAYNQRWGATVLLTSHYMDDVTALCPRIIVIDRGKLVYDGDLKALIRQMRPERRLTVRLSSVVAPERLTRLGATVVAHGDSQVVFGVKPERLNETVREVLASLPVADLSIEDPPLEEIMRELFQRDTATRDDSEAARVAEAARAAAGGERS